MCHNLIGATENAGVEKSARSKMQGWKRREWKHRHDFAGVENAGVETSARFCGGGKCRSGKIGTILQGWKMREWKHRERSILQNVMLGSAEKRMVA